MGVFSEMEVDRQYVDDPFPKESAPPAFTEQEPPAWGEPAAAPPTFEDEGLQSAEAEAAPAVLAQLNQEVDSEPAAPQDAGKSPAEVGETKESADEDAKRKAHEASEAQRKAEWEARQQKKKAAVQEQLNRLAAMSNDDVMMASMKRVSADTEKLTRRNMKDCVSEYIQTKCLEDPAFARRVMHPSKSMIHCIWYINRKAREFIEQELKDNDMKPENGVYGSDVPDELCYQWAVDYFNDPDAKEDQEKDEKFVPKPYTGGTAAKGKKGKASKGKAADKKADATKKTAAKESPKKPDDNEGQLSLLGVA